MPEYISITDPDEIKRMKETSRSGPTISSRLRDGEVLFTTSKSKFSVLGYRVRSKATTRDGVLGQYVWAEKVTA